MSKVDVRGMSCPQPVLITKNAIKSNPASIKILVDDNTAKNNVSRFLENSGYKLSIREMDEDYLISAEK
ncbi:MAG: sulfurtransferase TusA family protein [Anaeromicrobium sp.]|jgi:TusA-related sulfurtransferase|uniref:sulfurtransferase TusA family protein n=1 Tax=Anaeromicrobium sp. TaxID=1929132 RepID=UPI0025DE7417|nr:sulfurtransferase TusA family protein [Anaeromicrobium sp.]MCT4594261.1 sulfurtransferase TusA family protein [Anaeromicrobium sp.]